MFKILCIDDNKNNLFTVTTILEQLDNVEIITSLSAMDGLSVLLSREIDLILLDIQMPEMDGFEAAGLIKANKTTTHIPIIFLTAVFHSDEFKKKGFALGAVEYLTKPIDDNKLLNKVRLFKRLIESEKSLRKQQKYIQAIIDMQNQILLVCDKNSIETANRRFFDFFGYANLKEFKKEYRCVCQFFIEKDGFLPPSSTEDDQRWLNIIKNNPEEMHLAIVQHRVQNRVQHKVKQGDKHGGEYGKADVIMSVDATLLDAQKELYVVTLTDVTQMHSLQEQFRHQSLTDKLTGAFNRTKFDAVYDNAILDVPENPFTMAIFDIDHFKKVNDDFGHLVGDSVLKELVELIENNIRTRDLLARWGGEEFILIFFTFKSKIIILLEKLRILVEEYSFTGVDRPVTISIGFGEYNQSMDKESFLKNIDSALYKAKNSGRNRTIEID